MEVDPRSKTRLRGSFMLVFSESAANGQYPEDESERRRA
jgi:hypothetical protein